MSTADQACNSQGIAPAESWHRKAQSRRGSDAGLLEVRVGTAQITPRAGRRGGGVGGRYGESGRSPAEGPGRVAVAPRSELGGRRADAPARSVGAAGDRPVRAHADVDVGGRAAARVGEHRDRGGPLARGPASRRRRSGSRTVRRAGHHDHPVLAARRPSSSAVRRPADAQRRRGRAERSPPAPPRRRRAPRRRGARRSAPIDVGSASSTPRRSSRAAGPSVGRRPRPPAAPTTDEARPAGAR